MMKRATWFVGGVAAGAIGANYAKRKVVATASQISPGHVARTVVDRARDAGHDVIDALREGRQVARQHEDELRARREGRIESLEDHVEPGDRVYVDGVPVESGRVIVMRHRRRAARP